MSGFDEVWSAADSPIYDKLVLEGLERDLEPEPRGRLIAAGVLALIAAAVVVILVVLAVSGK